MNASTRDLILRFQKNEITEHHIYSRIANTLSDSDNRSILKQIANEEKRHYSEWKEVTGQKVKPNRIKIWFYGLLNRLFGYTFTIKLLERGEEDAQDNYRAIEHEVSFASRIAEEEDDHEAKLINMLDEERLHYIGSIVLGLNDALVELTGALAGLTLALQNTQLIALTGLITGIAAAFSMAASEYLSTKAEESEKHPVKASIYTGMAYIFTVFLLILPYLLFSHYYVCLALTLVIAILIISIFNYYISVAKDLNFKNRFVEMASLSMGVALLSFLVGFVLRSFFGIDV
jgi:VIT1/CCC1 family predicted Fe2+/Mn2+ transporter